MSSPPPLPTPSLSFLDSEEIDSEPRLPPTSLPFLSSPPSPPHSSPPLPPPSPDKAELPLKGEEDREKERRGSAEHERLEERVSISSTNSPTIEKEEKQMPPKMILEAAPCLRVTAATFDDSQPSDSDDSESVLRQR